MKTRSLHTAAMALGFLLGFAASCSSNPHCTGSNCTGTGGGNSATLNCAARCEAKLTGCGAPSSAVAENCPGICAMATTEAQMLCLEAQSCITSIENVKRNCGFGTSGTGGGSGSGGGNSGTGGGSSGTGGGSSGTGGGSTACIALAQSGCSSLNAPSNCCPTSGRPDIVCNGNNDGQNHAQCCVNPGKTCVQDSDCCGHAATPNLYACCPSTKKCGFPGDCT